MRYLLAILFSIAALTASAAQFEIQTGVVADIEATSGTVTATVTRAANPYTHQPQGPTEWAIAWTSNADGYVLLTTDQIQGAILEMRTDPGATAPTDNYDLTISRDGTDILNGAGINRDTSNTEIVTRFVDDSTTPTAMTPRLIGENVLLIAAAGDEKVGVIYLIIDER